MRKILALTFVSFLFAACANGSNGEKSAGRSAENAKGVVNSIGPKLWGPGTNKKSSAESSKKSTTSSETTAESK